MIQKMFYTALVLLFPLSATPYAQDLFGPRSDYPAGDRPTSVFVSDLDGDGDNDLAVAGLDYVSVLLNNGNGTFAPKVNYPAGDWPISVFIADLDGDGDNDLAVAGGVGASVLLNNGDGTFARRADYAAGHSPRLVFIADLDGDGNNDLAVANAGSNNVSVLLNLSTTPATINE